MLQYFGLLAWDALSGPLAYILLDVRPNKLISNRLTGPFHARMSEAMDNVEDATSVGMGDEGTCGSIRNVHEEIS